MLDRVKTILFGVVLMGSAGVATVAQASVNNGIGIDASRLVFNEGAGVISVGVHNSSPTRAYLMSVKVMKTLDGDGDTPFIATPPIFRIEPASIGSVRISSDSGRIALLPRDRESVYYFQVTGIPKSNPLERTGGPGFVGGGMTFAMGNIIKLFYRPAGLPSSSAEAIKGLTFTRVSGGIQVKNASPYYVNLLSLKIGNAKVKLGDDKDKSKKNVPIGMLSPFSDVMYFTQGVGSAQWSALNDIGGVVKASGTVK